MRTLKNYIDNKLCEITLKVVHFSWFSLYSFDANVPLFQLQRGQTALRLIKNLTDP